MLKRTTNTPDSCAACWKKRGENNGTRHTRNCERISESCWWYINYNYQPDGQPVDNMLNQQSTDNMLSDVNDIQNNYFPWVKDFVAFQFTDAMIRLDIADRQFLGGYW